MTVVGDDAGPAGAAYDLARFTEAQDRGGTYERALEELRAGAKRSHWMWFVFPQIAGLGHSPTARHYAIASAGEARAYVRHPVLGPRLLACAGALCTLTGRSARQIFGDVDAMKLCSSMTLFACVADDPAPFQRVLDQYFDGVRDPATEQRL